MYGQFPIRLSGHAKFMQWQVMAADYEETIWMQSLASEGLQCSSLSLLLPATLPFILCAFLSI